MRWGIIWSISCLWTCIYNVSKYASAHSFDYVQYFLFLRHRFASSQYPFIYSSNFRMFFPIFF